MPEKTIVSPALSVITLGCKVNQYESESLQAEMKASGWKSDHRPDVCIVNTCSVTHKAAFQSRQAIRRAIRDYPGAVIIATGCYAQSEPQVLQKIEGLDYIIGNAQKENLPEILSGTLLKQGRFPQKIMGEFSKIETIGRAAAGSRARPFIKIQDGCEAFCTYCIVPYTRGPSRSLAPHKVLEQIESLSDQGAMEVVLSGIHLGKYGLDLNPPFPLINLLRQIHRQNRIHRIRLSSIEPGELTQELLTFIADSGRICDHLHIPLQSGDAQVLKKMGRPYTPDEFSSLVRRIRALLPDAAIGADVMVGFPGETKEAFANTYSLLETLPVTYLHVFPFSPRPNTPASRYPDPVPADEIRKRRQALTRMGAEKKKTFHESMMGKALEVIIEDKRDSKTGWLKGMSKNYVRVLIDGDNRLKNRMIICRPDKISDSGDLMAAI